MTYLRLLAMLLLATTALVLLDDLGRNQAIAACYNGRCY